MSVPLIQLTNVTKLYGQVIGVNDMTFALPRGAHGLLGPNGSGKTTLLNLVTGQLKPTLGALRVLGHVPRNSAVLHRRLGYCPGSEGLYSTVSGLEWVQYLLELQGVKAAAAKAIAIETLEMVGMGHAMHRPIAGYSRGMRQRTKLAQAIAHDPEFLVLDEPFNGLDPIARHEMTELLRTWIGRGKSLLLASHVLHEVESITRSFLLISGGRLLASGTNEEVQKLLAGVPNEVILVCDRPRDLARILLEHGEVNSLHFDEGQLVIATRQPAQLFSDLPKWLSESGIQVSDVSSADESLQSLFDSLMKIHRGEI